MYLLVISFESPFLFNSWAGRITYLHVLGQGLVFLNKAEVVFDLLDKRGAIYSDRPRLIMTGELYVCQILLLFDS